MKRKKTADVSIRIYKQSRKQLKVLAAKHGLSLAAMLDRLIAKY